MEISPSGMREVCWRFRANLNSFSPLQAKAELISNLIITTESVLGMVQSLATSRPGISSYSYYFLGMPFSPFFLFTVPEWELKALSSLWYVFIHHHMVNHTGYMEPLWIQIRGQCFLLLPSANREKKMNPRRSREHGQYYLLVWRTCMIPTCKTSHIIMGGRLLIASK